MQPHYAGRTSQVQTSFDPPSGIDIEQLQKAAEQFQQASMKLQVLTLVSSMEAEPYMTADLVARLEAWKSNYSGYFDNPNTEEGKFKAITALTFLYTDVVGPLITVGGVAKLFDYKDKLVELIESISPYGMNVQKLFGADNRTDIIIQKRTITSNTLINKENKFRVSCQNAAQENQQSFATIKDTAHASVNAYRDAVADLAKEQEEVLNGIMANAELLVKLDEQAIGLSEAVIYEDRRIQGIILQAEAELSKGVKQ